MSLVIAIDVGVKNLAICAYDFLKNQVVFWDNVTLVTQGRYIPANNVQYVLTFVNEHRQLFDDCHMLLIERQMRCNMRIIEAVFQTLFFQKCRVISPRSVKAHYDLSTRNYRANKEKAVEWATAFVTTNPVAFTDESKLIYNNSTKKDDLADSLLLIMYYLDTYSNQLLYQ